MNNWRPLESVPGISPMQSAKPKTWALLTVAAAECALPQYTRSRGCHSTMEHRQPIGGACTATSTCGHRLLKKSKICLQKGRQSYPQKGRQMERKYPNLPAKGKAD